MIKTIDIKHSNRNFCMPLSQFAITVLIYKNISSSVSINIHKGGISDRSFEPNIKEVLKRLLIEISDIFTDLKSFSGTVTVVNDMSKGGGLPVKLKFDDHK